jgi:pimeloyl-ACP methyl ester carboxylesterase
MTTPSAPVELLDLPEGRIGYDVKADVTGKGPLVVCLPGMGELRSSYRFTMPALVAGGFRVSTMDLRGHGDSDATFSSYDDVAAGQDALALIEHLGGPAVLVGNSMTAGAAVWAAAERPEQVSGLALIGPFVRDVPTPALMRWAFRAAMSGPWAPRIWRAYLPKLYPGNRPDDFDEHLSAIAESMRRPGHAKAFAATTRTSHAPAQARLAEVRAPALVVMGECDPDFPDPVGEAKWVAGRLNGETVMVPGAGHYPQVERPDVVNPPLVAFCERVSRRA